MLSRFVIAFLPRSKRSFNFTAAVTICSNFGAQKTKSVTASTFILSICHEVMGLDAMIFVFGKLSLSQLFHYPLSPLPRSSLVPLHFLPLELYHLVDGLPRWLSRLRIRLQCRRHRFDLWVRKIPWRRKWQPTPVFLPGESQGRPGLVGCHLWGCTESDTTEAT